ncbi:MAG: type IV toxin-antitoxin system AbiEi family antitoxin domain-containing protein, partial [Trebonia sp.]
MPEAWEESDAGRRLDTKVATTAARQHGVLALAQCLALGLSARAVQRRAAAGRLHRIHRGVYALVPVSLLRRDALFMAAVLACGPEAALSHRSAGLLHGLIRGKDGEIDVTAATDHRVPGIRIHHSRTLTARDTTRVRGIPCTTIPRTLLDLADVVPGPQLEHALNQAEVMSRLNLRALDDQLARNARRTAACRLRQALGFYRPGQPPPERGLEEAFVELLRDAPVPAPERQVVLDLRDGGNPIRPDFIWSAARLVLETDGRDVHATRLAFESDRIRDQRLM